MSLKRTYPSPHTMSLGRQAGSAVEERRQDGTEQGRTMASVHRLRPTDKLGTSSSGSSPCAEDAALVRALRCGDPGAPVVLFDRYSRHVEKLLYRVLGKDDELGDLLHEVFAEVLDSVADISEPDKLKAWLTRVTVFTARGAIRRRQRRRWLTYRPPELLPVQAEEATAEQCLLLTRVYDVLARLPTDERIAFTLRHIEDMSLAEAALGLNVSLATFKRLLKSADQRFARLAGKDPVLAERLAQGTRGAEA